MNKRTTLNNITTLAEDEIFVFGSNLAGRHGAGAAGLAWEKFGAIKFQGEGLQGQSYALPTKDHKIETLPLTQIQTSVDSFVYTASLYPEKKFLVTEVGCGLAGFTPAQIAPLFKKAAELENVWLPQRFWDVLQENYYIVHTEEDVRKHWVFGLSKSNMQDSDRFPDSYPAIMIPDCDDEEYSYSFDTVENLEERLQLLKRLQKR